MRVINKIIYMVMLLAVFGCGNSFYEAQDYLTGPVSGVGLKKSTTIASGGTEQLSAVVVPSKTSNKGVTWTSSDNSIVSVDANGLVSAVVVVAHGYTKQAVITVTTSEGGYSTQCTVTVVEKPVAVTGVTLNRSSAYLYYQSGSIYSTDQLAATITPSAATNQAITWSSDDPTIASVNNGLVTPNRTGSTVIRVTTADGGYSASCTYTVTASPVLVTGISLNKSALTLAAGYSETLFASIVPTTATNQTLTWTSSTSAATVDALGSVTGVSAGTSVIRATVTENIALYAEATVTVVSTPVSVTGVTVSPKTATVAVGSQQTLAATITPSGATNQNLEWNSNNSGIVSVSSSGIITGIAAGNAKVTVTTIDGSYTATSYITVSSEPTYAVTYYPNNPATGTTSGSVPADTNGYISGSTVTVRNNGTIANTLNTFTGWNTQAGGGGTPYSPGSTFTMGSADVSLYAQWSTAATYTVTYDGNFNTGGSVPADSSYTSGTTVTVASNSGSLVRSGFVFGGWYISSGTILTAGSGTFTMPAHNTTLYAYWIPVYTVTYIANGSTSGTVPVDSTSYTSASTVTVKTNTGTLAKTGYSLAGWYTGSGTYYYPGQTFTMGSSNIILYANWGVKTVYITSTDVTLTNNCLVIVKAWGAGGQGSSSNGYGGSGGYSYSVFTASANDVLYIVVGVGGGNTRDTTMPALGGINGHAGGGGSLAAILSGGVYTLKCCAGGGGGGGAGAYVGGSGGGASGQAGIYSPTGGSGGTGGSGTISSGSNMLLTSATLLGLGGNGGNAGGLNGGAGGGGFGGGGTNGYSTLNHGGSGGGGYAVGDAGVTITGNTTGSSTTPGNSTDSDIPDGFAQGGFNASAGENGYVVVYIINQ